MYTGILIFEDNPAFRDDLESLIRSHDGYLFLGAFPNAEEAASRTRDSKADLVLMDIDMPGVDGISGVKQIRAAGLTLPVVMLTAFDDSNNVFEAICAGASGYLLKSTPPDRIFAGIDEVMKGGAAMSPVVAAKAMQLLASQHRKSDDAYGLTDKESQILALLVAGNSYKLIAAALNVGRETVKTHIRSIYGKLQVHSSTEAVSKALRERIV